MQTKMLRPSTCGTAFYAPACRASPRVVRVQAKAEQNLGETCKRAAAAVGAVLLVASPFAGPALARPSDFIQSKPSSSPNEPTNVDKFPFNPSTTGNQAGKDTGDQTNPQQQPQSFSTTKGLGSALTGSEANDPLPSPTEMGPDAQNVGK